MKNQIRNTRKNDGVTLLLATHARKLLFLSLAEDLCVASWNRKATRPILEQMIELAHELPVEEFSDFSKSMLNASRHDWDVAEIFLSYELDWDNAADHIAALCRLYGEYWSIDATSAARKVRTAIIGRSAQFRFYNNEKKGAA